MAERGSAEDCIFCKIAAGEIPSKKVREDEALLAFEDINPQAPVHILIIPKAHIPTLLDLKEGDEGLLGAIFRLAGELARERGIAERGFRLVANCNPESGQSVFHIHFHLLGGRPMRWPPG
ncbi:MAG: histidine triad nucleotide-binding protein [Nitrospinota bacterium]